MSNASNVDNDAFRLGAQTDNRHVVWKTGRPGTRPLSMDRHSCISVTQTNSSTMSQYVQLWVDLSYIMVSLSMFDDVLQTGLVGDFCKVIPCGVKNHSQPSVEKFIAPCLISLMHLKILSVYFGASAE